MIPYGRQSIDEDDIWAVVKVLRSAYLTTGPQVAEFERVFAEAVGAKQAVAVSSGTAALHCAVNALGVGPGDEVVVPAMTFAATGNCAVFEGATPVFADVDPETLLIDPCSVESRISTRTRAIVAVDYAGQPCDYDSLNSIADRYGVALIADACHSLGAVYKGEMVASIAKLTAFSLHPVKHITTGEGGVIATDDVELASRMRMFRNHGIDSDHKDREDRQAWYYEMLELGYNYRLTDFQCALGLSQLKKLGRWLHRRREIARSYDEAFSTIPGVRPLKVRPEVEHAYHLYVVRLADAIDRDAVFKRLREEGLRVNVHYIPVHLHPYYRREFGTGFGLCPVAEEAYQHILTLPLFPSMTDRDVRRVISIVGGAVNEFSFGGPGVREEGHPEV